MAHIYDIPEELVEMIVCQLDLESTCSMRLASSALCLNSSNGHFRTYFHRERLLLADNLDQLQAFSEMTLPHKMGRFVQHLTVIGDVSCLDQYLGLQPTVAGLLRRGLTHVRLYSKHRCLKTLTLDVKAGNRNGDFILTRDYPDWMRVWRMAACVYRDTMQALCTSELAVESVDVFAGIERCSLSCEDLPLLKPVLSASLRPLKSLSLSLSQSPDMVVRRPKRPMRQRCTAAAVATAKAFEDMLDAAPDLKVLSLHWCSLKYTNPTVAQFLNRIVDPPQFTALEDCSVSGISCEAASLIRFFRHVRLRRLRLLSNRLTRGVFRPLFDHFTSSCPLECIHLDLLFEQSSYVDFYGGYHGSALMGTGEAAQRPILYSAHDDGDYAGHVRHTYGPP